MRNDLLAKIVAASGGTVTNKDNRNELLRDWLETVGGEMNGWYNKQTGAVICSDTLIECNEELIICP